MENIYLYLKQRRRTQYITQFTTWHVLLYLSEAYYSNKFIKIKQINEFQQQQKNRIHLKVCFTGVDASLLPYPSVCINQDKMKLYMQENKIFGLLFVFFVQLYNICSDSILGEKKKLKYYTLKINGDLWSSKINSTNIWQKELTLIARSRLHTIIVHKQRGASAVLIIATQ